jgi:hypothetical protein
MPRSICCSASRRLHEQEGGAPSKSVDFDNAGAHVNPGNRTGGKRSAAAINAYQRAEELDPHPRSFYNHSVAGGRSQQVRRAAQNLDQGAHRLCGVGASSNHPPHRPDQANAPPFPRPDVSSSIARRGGGAVRNALRSRHERRTLTLAVLTLLGRVLFPKRRRPVSRSCINVSPVLPAIVSPAREHDGVAYLCAISVCRDWQAGVRIDSARAVTPW